MKDGPQRQFLLFAAAGVIGLLVDSAVLYTTAPWLGWYAARVLSFVTAATTTWGINRRHAFAPVRRDADAMSPWSEYARYLLSMTAGGCINYAVYLVVLRYIDPPAGPLLGVAAGSCCGLVFNFAAARYLVFGRSRAR